REARSLQTSEATPARATGGTRWARPSCLWSPVMISLRSPLATCHGAPSVGPMPGALSDLALGMGARPLAGLTAGAGRRLVSACHAFAALIEADPGPDARF